MGEMNDITGLEELQKAMADLRRIAPEAVMRGLSRCGLLGVREAKKNAPRSPTNRILSATLKRKKRTARKMLPGGLEKSIEYEVTPLKCALFVASNSFAGKYARRIHDEKGKTWFNRGAGTIAKGSRADEGFILRAIRDNTAKFTAIMQDELRKALPQ